MVQFSANKVVEIVFRDGKTRTIEHIAAQGTPAGFIVFEMPNGNSVHLNLECIESMEFSGLAVARQKIITQ